MDETARVEIRGHKLFSELTDEEISLLYPLLKKKRYAKGEYILKEQEEGKCVYLILLGSVEILKTSTQDNLEHVLSSLGKESWFGEMALFGDSRYSASVRALEDTEVVLIPIQELKRLSKEQMGYARIAWKMGDQIADRLRATNEVAVDSLSSELKLSRSHGQMGHIIIHLIILMTLYFYTFKTFSQYGTETLTNKIITVLLIFGFGLSAAFLVKKSENPLSFFGLNFKNWKKDLMEGILFTLPVLLILLLAKAFLIHYVPEFSEEPLFSASTKKTTYLYFFHTKEKEPNFLLFMTLYLLLVPIQEFIARGCLQSCLEDFFHLSHKTFWAILTSNLLFGMFHGFRSITFAITAFFLGIFWGWLYSRHHCLLAPTISHILVGIWAFVFLNFSNLIA